MNLEDQHPSSFSSLARRPISLADAVEAMVDAVIVVDASESIVWLNGCAERLFGFARSELLGRSFRAFVSEGIDAGDGILTGGPLDGGAVHWPSPGCPVAASRRRLNQARISCKNGDTKSVDVHVSPVLLGDTTVEICALRPIAAIRGNERRVKQVLVNLLDNALKFTREGGSMGIDVEQDLERGKVSFSVWDTGIGIATEHIPQLFKPFSQLEHGLAKQHAGTGLGLSLVKRLAEMHGGSVSVDSSVGVGSRFTVSLPHTPRMAYIESSPPPSYHTQRTNLLPPGILCTVLVVDDNLSNLQMLRDYLMLKGYNILTAQSGPEALDILESTSIHAVLMDIQMPGMDGLEVIRILRRDPRFAALPIIAVTALAMTGDRERCLAAGATEYAPKPLSPRQVAIALARLLHS